MFFYVLIVVVLLGLLFFSYVYPNAEKKIGLVFLVIIVLIGGLRDGIGIDYPSYTLWYLKGTRDSGFEFGFLAIMKVLRYWNIGYHFLFFFFSFFTYLFIYLGVRKYTKKSTLPLVLYFLVPSLFLFSFSAIRQCFSIAISFYAFSYLLDRKYFIYFSLMLVGVSIHYSCLIPFILFTLVYKFESTIKVKYLYVSLVFSFILSRFGIIHMLSLLFKDSHYLYYVSDKHALPVSILKLLIFNVVGAFVVWYYDKNGFKHEQQKYFLTLYMISILILNLFSESTELTRIYIYFRIFEILLIADIINDVLFKKKYALVSVFVCCFYLLPYFRAVTIDSEKRGPEGLKLIPYKTLLLSGINFN